MKIYDISQEVFGCQVYPGDQAPCKIEDRRMSRGDLYNLTNITMGLHNGTHIDAPYHFYEDGDSVEQIPLEKTVGDCYVTEQSCDVDAEAAKEIISRAKSLKQTAFRRILIKGCGMITAEAAKAFAEAGIDLLGVESQTVGPADTPMEVHKILLKEKVVLLEGLRLADIAEGAYVLNAAPLLVAGVDGAPCRAILIEK